jgi:hypothetical protein
VAVVTGEEAFAKVTVPGPETMDHVLLRVPDGRPSSCTLPFRGAFDKPTEAFGPADTVGAWFDAALTLMVTVALTVNAPSDAVRRST